VKNLKIFITVVLGISFYLCSQIFGPDEDKEKEKVILEIYSPSDTTQMIDKDSVSIGDTFKVNYTEYLYYFVLAKSDGYFTQLFKCRSGDYIVLNLIPVDNSKYSGAIILKRGIIPVNVLANQWVKIEKNGEIVREFKTDSLGHFSTDKLEFGLYKFIGDGNFTKFSETVIVDKYYQDIFISNWVQFRKPNIYIYPETDTNIEIYLDFPRGGYITESLPSYDDGWKINVSSEGRINGTYECLYYEFNAPDLCQYDYGWVVERENLEKFFRQNMEAYGFNDKEIDDFIDYWVPKLNKFKRYIIFPQLNEDISRVIQIRCSREIDTLFRLYYAIMGTNFIGVEITPPEIYPFERNGFTIVEWGVILK